MIAEEELKHHINNAKNGNQSSYNILLNEYWNEIYFFIQSKSNDDNDAEDITITTFSKAFDKLKLYNDEYQFKTWLLTIAKNLIIDAHRKNKDETISIAQQEKRLMGLHDDLPSPEDIIINKQNLASLKLNIKKLKPKYQKVIYLRFFYDLSYQEIADRQEESINNVKVKLLRAKKLLSEIILKYDG